MKKCIYLYLFQFIFYLGNKFIYFFILTISFFFIFFIYFSVYSVHLYTIIYLYTL